MKLTLPGKITEGTFEVNALSEHRRLDPAYRVEKWLGGDHPTFIYHHGNGERPFDYGLGVKNTFYNILVREKDSIEANLICVRAPITTVPYGTIRKGCSTSGTSWKWSQPGWC